MSGRPGCSVGRGAFDPAAGSVIARKAGEEIRFIDVTDWRTVDVAQDLLAGDVLRTNATGQLAVLYGSAEALESHAALLADFYAGRLFADDPRFGQLSSALPALEAYYKILAQRAADAAPKTAAPVIAVTG